MAKSYRMTKTEKERTSALKKCRQFYKRLPTIDYHLCTIMAPIDCLRLDGNIESTANRKCKQSYEAVEAIYKIAFDEGQKMLKTRSKFVPMEELLKGVD